MVRHFSTNLKNENNDDVINNYVCLVFTNMISWPICSGKTGASSGANTLSKLH
jgi:hypothetical protein